MTAWKLQPLQIEGLSKRTWVYNFSGVANVDRQADSLPDCIKAFLTASRRCRVGNRHPLCHDGGQPLHNFVAEENLIYVSHVKHVDNATQIWATATRPPSGMCINHEVMQYTDLLVFREF